VPSSELFALRREVVLLMGTSSRARRAMEASARLPPMATGVARHPRLGMQPRAATADRRAARATTGLRHRRAGTRPVLPHRARSRGGRAARRRIRAHSEVHRPIRLGIASSSNVSSRRRLLVRRVGRAVSSPRRPSCLGACPGAADAVRVRRASPHQVPVRT
jgi:hypothetical protein